jgi:hypothetical protein
MTNDDDGDGNCDDGDGDHVDADGDPDDGAIHDVREEISTKESKEQEKL